METFARILLTLALLAIIGFCLFGFLATYESPDLLQRLPWQIGYGLGGLVCVFVAFKIWLPRRRGNTQSR